MHRMLHGYRQQGPYLPTLPVPPDSAGAAKPRVGRICSHAGGCRLVHQHTGRDGSTGSSNVTARHAVIRHGSPPYLECSSRGDRRFSAFAARIRQCGNRSIEEIYQAAKVFDDGMTGLSWRAAKGRKAVNMDDCVALYSLLWDLYIFENPQLLSVLRSTTGLSDIFGQPGHCC